MRGWVGIGVLLTFGVGALFYLQSREQTEAEDAPDASLERHDAEVPFGNLQWTHRGPTPIPIQTHGWNESGLRALLVMDGQPHVVMREPSVDGDEAVYALRPIDADGLGEPVMRHGGVLERVVPGSSSVWVVSANTQRVLSWTLGAASEDSTQLFAPAEEHSLNASELWVRDDNLVGAAFTERLIYATDERPRREMSEDPETGGTRVRVTGPRPTSVERWLTPLGARERPVRFDTMSHPPSRRIESSLVVGSAAGSALLLFERTLIALAGLVDDSPDAVSPDSLQVVRFGADGRELWRRRTPLTNRAFEPIAHLADDGTLEAAWRIDGSIVSVTLSEHEPQPFRTIELEGEINQHALWLTRCGGQSWLFHLDAPRGERTVSRHRVQTSSLDDGETIYQGILSHDGRAPTRSADEGHHEWVDAYNGAHLRLELACQQAEVLVALDVPIEPTTSDRGLMLFDESS